MCVWFLFSYKILGLKAAKSFFCVYVWVWFYAWFRSFKAVEVKFWSFLVVCEFFFLLSFVGVFCYLNVVKIVTFCLSRFTCVQPNRKILSKCNGHASNSTHESKCVLCWFQPLFGWFSKLIETDVTLSCASYSFLFLCVGVSSQFSRSVCCCCCMCVLVCFVSFVVFISCFFFYWGVCLLSGGVANK